MIAQSWDVDLARSLGRIVGREMAEYGVHSWLAPGMNIHRNPLCGRNFEYYSEDPLLSGMMAAADTLGVQETPGVGTTPKHFACNNQEDDRNYSDSIVSEQALREIYLRGFEICVRSAQPMFIMTSYNFINGVHAAMNRDTLTYALRNEWGFRGFVICDFNTIPQYMIPKQMYYAGGDLDLATLTSSMWMDPDTSDTGDAVVLGKAVKNLLYAFVNSNAMNAEVIGYKPAVWRDYLKYADIGLGAVIVLWGVWAFVHNARKKKKANA